MMQTATVLDGKETSKAVLADVSKLVQTLTGHVPPKLVAVLVGNDPASEVYVGRKMKAASKVGIVSETKRLPDDVPQETLMALLSELNADNSVHAILVQLPLPNHLDTGAVLETIDPDKDVDGFHPMNIGKLLLGIEPTALPCTPAGVMMMMDRYSIELSGKRAAVVGRSNIVGKPISLMLTHRHATVTLCHSRTPNLETILADADVVVAAAGQPGLIQASAIKSGAIVIDVGINRLDDGRLVGDVDYESIAQKAGYVTPVPGGVGPMTIAMLMMNTVRLAQVNRGIAVEPFLLK